MNSGDIVEVCVTSPSALSLKKGDTGELGHMAGGTTWVVEIVNKGSHKLPEHQIVVVDTVKYDYQNGYTDVPLLVDLEALGQQFHRQVFRLYEPNARLNTVKFQPGSVVFLHDKPERGFELKPDQSFKGIGARAPSQIDQIKEQIIQLLKDNGCA